MPAINELIARMEEAAVKSESSGVISVFQGTTPLLNKAYGYRDVKEKLHNRTDTLFGIASGTKIFTALGIGVLIDRGLLSLETAVGEIDPTYTGFVDPRATVRHLLTHTSGIFDYYDEEIVEDFDNFHVEIPWNQLETPSDYAPLFQGQGYKFEPDERWSYSNGGFVFLGMLIEKLSGELYRDFVQEHVLAPAGMARSGFHALNDLPPNTANGYLEDGRTTNIYQLPLRGGGDGGMFTTTYEIRRFWEAFVGGRILSPELTRTFLETQWRFDDRRGYGCGVYKRLDDNIFYLIGGDAGVGFYSAYLVEEQVVINVFTNVSGGEMGVTKVLRERLWSKDECG